MWGASALSALLLAASCGGNDGQSATVTAEPAGANCVNGGVKVQVGTGTATYVCNGAKGTDGTAGASVTVTAEPAGKNCADGGVKVQVGTGTATYVCAGTKGADGTSTTVTAEAAGANCVNGGVKVQVGTATPVYACNGAKGTDGGKGSDGASATVTPEPAGANCANGGVKVQVGAGAATYACNGAKGSDGSAGASATVTPEPAGANCANGGVKVQVGTGTPTYACNGAKGSDGQGTTVTPEPAGVNCPYGGVKVQVGTGTPSYVCGGYAVKYYVFVRGHFASSDMAVNKSGHDAIVASHRASVTAAGDEKHLALLGAQDPRQFLGLDVWNNLDGFYAFASDPAVQAAFAALFDAPPTLSINVAPQGYLTWGTLAPHVTASLPVSWVVSVRGTFALSTASGNMAAHNQVAGGGEVAAQTLGDVGHLAFLDMANPNTFQAVDEWDSFTGLQTFVSDPAVQAAFASLFSGPPTFDIYTTSDFAQY